jgi:hypothetical protein
MLVIELLAITTGALFVFVPPSRPAVADSVPPVISSLSVSRGIVTTSLVIGGSGLSGATSIRFNGGAVEAGFTVIDDSQVSTSVPDGASTGSITVTTPSGSATSSIFTVPPTITGFSPTSAMPSDTVTITGTAFVGVKVVYFPKGIRAVYQVVDYHTISAVVPPESPSGRLTVSTVSGGTTSSAIFTVLAPSPSPTPTPTTTPPPSPYACTRVLGFSQTRQWYVSGNFEAYVPAGNWEAQVQNGVTFDLYTDPNSTVWSVPVYSPCSSGPLERVVLTVGIKVADGNLVSKIRTAIDNIRTKWPSVREIVLQPEVGGPQESVCYYNGTPVASTVQHPSVEAAIAQVAGGDVVIGADPHVSDCSMFSDFGGHLYASGYTYVAQLLGNFYATFP